MCKQIEDEKINYELIIFLLNQRLQKQNMTNSRPMQGKKFLIKHNFVSAIFFITSRRFFELRDIKNIIMQMMNRNNIQNY